MIRKRWDSFKEVKCMETDKYLECRPNIKTGDMILWKDNGPLGWLIRKFSKGDYNHVSLVVSIEEYDELIDRRFVLEANSPGIILRSLSNEIKDTKGESHWYPLKDEFNDKRMDIGNWAFQRIGVKYDYIGLFRQIFGRISANTDRFFCSEFVYYAWKSVGIKMNEDNLGLAPRPGDLPSLGIFKDVVKL